MSTSTKGFIFEEVGIAYDEQFVLEGVNGTFSQNQIHVLIGASGVGKSTLLNTLLGTLQPTEGRIVYKEKQYDPKDYIISLVPQNYGLLPWQTAREAMKDAQKITNRQDEALMTELIEQLDLSSVIDKYPRQLSGGQRQRVALARAFSVQGDIMLLDEPFGALDAINREVSQRLFLRLWQHHPATTLLITHDIEEALLLSDTLTILSGSPGKITKQVDNPLRHVPLKERKEHPDFYRWVSEWKGAI